MKELKEYLNVANWPGGPLGLKVDELVELTDLCQKKAKETYGGEDLNRALRNAMYEAVAAAFALGFERGQRKAENDQKRARRNRREKEAAEGAETA